MLYFELFFTHYMALQMKIYLRKTAAINPVPTDNSDSHCAATGKSHHTNTLYCQQKDLVHKGLQSISLLVLITKSHHCQEGISK